MEGERERESARETSLGGESILKWGKAELMEFLHPFQISNIEIK